MLKAITLAAAALTVAGCAATSQTLRTATSGPDIVDTAVAAGQFTTLAAALDAADLVDTLKGPGPFTVFAPTDDAFAALPDGVVADLLKPENKAQLQSVLTYHVVPGAITSDQLAGQTIDVATVQGATVAVDGTSGVSVNEAMVTTADIGASNGVIHVIDSVLLPPAPQASGDIVDTAVAAGSFNTLVAAVQAAGLVETLKSDGPFTVFAPTDAAFAKLPAGTVETLLKPENKAALVEVLTYHVVAGDVRSDALKGKSISAKTVEGRSVAIDGRGAKVVVNGAIVEAADVPATNGVIHVIDTVLLPH